MRISDREHNRLKVLRTLRRAEPVSRTDLAGLAGLDGGTITEISTALLRRGLILEDRVATGRRGRPQQHLRLDPDGAFALGAYVGIGGELMCETVNLRGDRLHLSAQPFGATRSLAQFSETVGRLIDAAIVASGFDRTRLSRIGVAIPGMVDHARGVIHWVQTFDPEAFPAARVMEDILGIPVTLDNNTNVLARAEHWFGNGGEHDTFTLISLGFGISAARYLDGALLAGANRLNSELGHSKIVLEGGLPCSCGAYGCLAAHCAIDALVRQCCEATAAAIPDMQRQAAALGDFAAQARAGRPEIQQVFARAGRWLAIAIANHINTSDPGRVIVLCEHPDLPAILEEARDAIMANCLPPLRTLTTVEFGAFGEDLFGKGAAALVLEELYRTL